MIASENRFDVIWLYFFTEEYVCAGHELSERYSYKVSAWLPGVEIEYTAVLCEGEEKKTYKVVQGITGGTITWKMQF